MVSMSCCKAGASLSSDLSGPYLVFLISLESSNTKVDGIRFYRAPGGHQMFSPVDLGWTRWRAPLLICLLWQVWNSALLDRGASTY